MKPFRRKDLMTDEVNLSISAIGAEALKLGLESPTASTETVHAPPPTARGPGVGLTKRFDPSALNKMLEDLQHEEGDEEEENQEDDTGLLAGLVLVPSRPSITLAALLGRVRAYRYSPPVIRDGVESLIRYLLTVVFYYISESRPSKRGVVRLWDPGAKKRKNEGCSERE
eukprot:g48227.t1